MLLLFKESLSEEELNKVPSGYFIEDDILMKKWRPTHTHTQDRLVECTSISVAKKIQGKSASDGPQNTHGRPFGRSQDTQTNQ